MWLNGPHIVGNCHGEYERAVHHVPAQKLGCGFVPLTVSAARQWEQVTCQQSYQAGQRKVDCLSVKPIKQGQQYSQDSIQCRHAGTTQMGKS